MTDWLDQYGLLNLHPQPDRGDNGMLFTSQRFLLRLEVGSLTQEDERLYHLMVAAHELSPGVYSQTPWNKNDPASHDNITGLVSVSVRMGYEYHKTLKIAGRFWHPRDIGFYNYCKGGWNKLAGISLLWFTKVAQYSTCNDDYKVRPHGKYVDTDGKLLTVCRCLGLKKKFAKTFKKCTEIIKKHGCLFDYQDDGALTQLDRWDRVFRFYFKNENHPNNVLADRIWKPVYKTQSSRSMPIHGPEEQY